MPVHRRLFAIFQEEFVSMSGRNRSAQGDMLLIECCIPEAHFCNRDSVQGAQQSVFATKRLVREYDRPGVDIFRQIIEDLVKLVSLNSVWSLDCREKLLLKAGRETDQSG